MITSLISDVDAIKSLSWYTLILQYAQILWNIALHLIAFKRAIFDQLDH